MRYEKSSENQIITIDSDKSEMHYY
jgi:hypothetical protein